MDPSSSTLHFVTEKTNGKAWSPKISFKSEAWPLMTKKINKKQRNVGSRPKISFKTKRDPWRRLESSLTHHSSPAANIPTLTCEFVIECICMCILPTYHVNIFIYVFYQPTNINLWLYFVFSAYIMYFVSYIFVLPTFYQQPVRTHSSGVSIEARAPHSCF